MTRWQSRVMVSLVAMSIGVGSTACGSTSHSLSDSTNRSRGMSASPRIAKHPAVLGDTADIHLTQPRVHEVQPGTRVMISGTVNRRFHRQVVTVQVSLFAHAHPDSPMLAQKAYPVNGKGQFSGLFPIPSKALPVRGAKMELWIELLAKGGPAVYTTLMVK